MTTGRRCRTGSAWINAREAFEATLSVPPDGAVGLRAEVAGACRGSSRRAASCGCWRCGCRMPTRRAIKGAQKDPLIGLGTAPLEDPLFRAAVFEQLGEQSWRAR